MLADMSKGEEPGAQTQVQIRAPQRFTSARLLVCTAYGLLVFLPTVLIAIIAVSFLQLSVLTLVLPLLMVAVATFFLPFAFGNAYVARLAEPLRPEDKEAILVQLAFVPRMRWGVSGMLEDADDIGWLSCSNDALVFRGDAVNLSIPLSRITSVRRENGGFRGLFLYSRTAVKVSGFEDFTGLRFAERSSQLLPSSWRIARRLYECVAGKVPQVSR